MIIRSNTLALLILFGSIVGFPLVAAIAELASINSTFISILVRAFITVISLVFLIHKISFCEKTKEIPNLTLFS